MIPNLIPAQDFRVSLSVSPFTEMVLEAGGTTFADRKMTATTVEGVQRLLMGHGANEVYARIATTQRYRTGAGDHSMDRGLERARLAAKLGLPFNPELGLFNIYGDIRCQPPPDFSDYPEIELPGPWASLTLDQMTAALRAYGATAARQIVETGAQVRIWDLGNEVEFGVAGVAVTPMPGNCDDTAGGAGWYRAPDAIDAAIGKMTFQTLMQLPDSKRAAWLEEHVWRYQAKLFATVAEGIREVDAKARFSTHVSGMAVMQPLVSVAFFQAMRAGGFDVDELGFSYYPTASPYPMDRLQAFKDMAARAHRELERPVFIAEFRVSGGAYAGHVSVQRHGSGLSAVGGWAGGLRARFARVGAAREGALGHSSLGAGFGGVGVGSRCRCSAWMAGAWQGRGRRWMR